MTAVPARLIKTDVYSSTLIKDDLLGQVEFNGETFPECDGAILQHLINHYFTLMAKPQPSARCWNIPVSVK